MSDDDKPHFAAALAELATLKSGTKLTKEQYGAWWNHMRITWTLDEFRAACHKLTDECEFMPGPHHFAKLRKAAATEAAVDAWTQVVAVNRGRADRATLSAKAERVVDSMGGWPAAHTWLTTEMQWHQKRFFELWSEVETTEEARVALPQLASPLDAIKRLAAQKAMPR